MKEDKPAIGENLVRLARRTRALVVFLLGVGADTLVTGVVLRLVRFGG